MLYCVTVLSITDEIGDGDSDVSKAQEHLLHSFRSGTSACLICIENIKKEDAVSFMMLPSV
jgi:hypothetical protein